MTKTGNKAHDPASQTAARRSLADGFRSLSIALDLRHDTVDAPSLPVDIAGMTKSVAWDTSVRPFSHLALADIVYTLSIALGHEYSDVCGEEYDAANPNFATATSIDRATEEAWEAMFRAEMSLTDGLIAAGEAVEDIIRKQEIVGGLCKYTPRHHFVTVKGLSDIQEAMASKFRHKAMAEHHFAFLKDVLSGKTSARYSEDALLELQRTFAENTTCKMHIENRAGELSQCLSASASSQKRFHDELAKIDRAQASMSEEEKRQNQADFEHYRPLIDQIKDIQAMMINSETDSPGYWECQASALGDTVRMIEELSMRADGDMGLLDNSLRSPEGLRSQTATSARDDAYFKSMSVLLAEQVKSFERLGGDSMDAATYKQEWQSIVDRMKEITAQLTAEEEQRLGGYKSSFESLRREAEAINQDTHLTVLEKYQSFTTSKLAIRT